MKARTPRVVPTLTEVLEIAGAPLRPRPPASPIDDEMRELVRGAVDAALAELRAQLLPRVEARLHEALTARLNPLTGGD